MDLKHLRAFVAVAKQLHFTKAAEEIHITQPALSLLIQQLETELELKLLTRNTRQVELTDLGREFLPLAKNVVNDMHIAVSQMQDIANMKRGRVSIATFPSVAIDPLPFVIRDFKALHPNIEVQIYDGIFETVLDKIRFGQADFGIASYPDDLTGMNFEKIYDDEIMLLVPKSHALATRNSVTWTEISSEEIIMPSPETGVRKSIDLALIKNDIQIKAMMNPSLIYTIAGLVAAEIGVGAVLASYRESVRSENIVTVKITEPIVNRPVGVLSRQDRQLTPAAEIFKKMTIDRLKTGAA